VDLEVDHKRLWIDASLGHAGGVVQPGMALVLRLEQGHQQLTTDVAPDTFDSGRPAGEIEDDLCSIRARDDTASVRKHRAVTSALGLIGPVNIPIQTLAARRPLADPPADA
jgi:hypothetical protein